MSAFSQVWSQLSGELVFALFAAGVIVVILVRGALKEGRLPVEHLPPMDQARMRKAQKVAARRHFGRYAQVVGACILGAGMIAVLFWKTGMH